MAGLAAKMGKGVMTGLGALVAAGAVGAGAKYVTGPSFGWAGKEGELHYDGAGDVVNAYPGYRTDWHATANDGIGFGLGELVGYGSLTLAGIWLAYQAGKAIAGSRRRD